MQNKDYHTLSLTASVSCLYRKPQLHHTHRFCRQFDNNFVKLWGDIRHFVPGWPNIAGGIDAYGQLEHWWTPCGEVPTSGPLGIVLNGMWENPDIIPLKSEPVCVGSRPHLTQSRLSLSKSTWKIRWPFEQYIMHHHFTLYHRALPMIGSLVR